ncbi:MAG: hypothetical protein DRP09_13700 [Candidatus Thorarchaeota archaeon]|nr:MAG: hypothetical protein DRP09_13700 [Candidatus Thorarchaeota archaeon]
MQMLTHILSRAVPNARVSHAVITDLVRGRWYFILVVPDHIEYWAQFKRRYFNGVRLAQERGAKMGGACPEFSTQKGLLDWLADTLGLSQGERRLLYICERV